MTTSFSNPALFVTARYTSAMPPSASQAMYRYFPTPLTAWPAACTTRMLDALARSHFLPERIILASTRAIYGEGAWRNNDTGDIIYPGQRSRSQLERREWDFPGLSFLPFAALSTEPRPTSIYGATKLAQEHILRAWALSFGTKVVILRLQNVYGPGQSLINSYTGIVSLFARLARAHKSIPIYEDGQMLRDFVFIDDALNF